MFSACKITNNSNLSSLNSKLFLTFAAEMKENITDFEIMAPVGSRDSLAAALKAGAGSVYFGVEQLNMRSHSANHFTIELPLVRSMG